MHDDNETNAKVLHDILQPLNVIRLSCGNIRARLLPTSDDDSDYVREKIIRIEEQANRATDLLRKWLMEQNEDIAKDVA